MKKLLAILFAGAISASAHAQIMDDWDASFSLVTTNSDTSIRTLRGEIESVFIDNAASKTSVVLITSSEQTIFSLTSTGDANYPIRVPTFTTTGGNASNSTQFVEWAKPAVAGEVTVRVAGAADTTGTNTTGVTIIYKK